MMGKKKPPFESASNIVNKVEDMDSLNLEEKERCLSFGSSMIAINGMTVSDEAAKEIEMWKKGEQTFLTMFEKTLRRYGFPVDR